MLRYIKRLEVMDWGLAQCMIALGSCTMKVPDRRRRPLAAIAAHRSAKRAVATPRQLVGCVVARRRVAT